MKIAALVSGGVDSSVALYLLKKQGLSIEAFYLKIWLEDELSHLGQCPWQEDLFYAQHVCDKLDIPLHVISLQDAYWDIVVNYVIEQARAGKTPSPDILCNQHIKFGVFQEKIGHQFDKIVTGHYATVEQASDNTYELKKAIDPIKDQTYFLAHLNQQQLGRLICPLGPYPKNQVREIATQAELATSQRPDSQGICFLGKIKYADFLQHHLGKKEGPLVDFETGKVLGTHNGYWFYTIGQRKGLGLSGGPWFVVTKDIDTNTVFISNKYFEKDKKRNSFYFTQAHWISNQVPQTKMLEVKIRHGQKTYPCTIQPSQHDTWLVQLPEDDQGLAPGQFAVFYNDQICIGCGVIT